MAVRKEPPKTTKRGSYGASDIQVLEGLEAVRRRPGMYIGTTDLRGLHHLVREILDNSIDEAMNGTCDRIDAWIHPNNEITVADNGRGIPVGPHPTQRDAKGKPMDALEVVMTILHAGGKFGGAGYKVSGGLHGVGVSVVNALSASMRVEVLRDGKRWVQEYSRGLPTSPVRQRGGAAEANKGLVPARDRRTGTRTFFMPDAEVFDSLDFSWDLIATRLRESAYLNKGLWICL